MPKYVIEASIVGEQNQNLHDWGNTWGKIQEEIQRFGGEVVDAYAVLGDHDFQFVIEADDEEAAVRISIAIERFGMDTWTNQLVDIERLGELIEDV